MKKVSRIILLGAILTGQVYMSFADRGAGRKKTKITLNIKAPATNNAASGFTSALNFNLRNGMKYTGSLINTSATTSSFAGVQNSLVTYQKGNSVYIMPYKQKVLVPADVRQGYAGTKLIIRVP